MSEIALEYPKASVNKHPGKYDVLTSIAHDYINGEVFITLASQAIKVHRDPRTVRATICGSDNTTPAQCFEKPTIPFTNTENISLDLNLQRCTFECSFWGACPIQLCGKPPKEYLTETQINGSTINPNKIPRITVDGRSGYINIGYYSSSIPSGVHESIFDLLIRGNLAGFEAVPFKSQPLYPSIEMYGQEIALKHPQILGREIVVEVGNVIPAGRNIVVTSPIEALYRSTSEEKQLNTFKNTQRVARLCPGLELPQLISYGTYQDSHFSWSAYTRPNGVEMLPHLISNLDPKLDKQQSEFKQLIALSDTYQDTMRTLAAAIKSLHGKDMVHGNLCASDIGVVNISNDQTSIILTEGLEGTVYIQGWDQMIETKDFAFKANEAGQLAAETMNLIFLNLMQIYEVVSTKVEEERMLNDILNLLQTMNPLSDLDELFQGNSMLGYLQKNLGSYRKQYVSSINTLPEFFVRVSKHLLEPFLDLYIDNDDIYIDTVDYLRESLDEKYLDFCKKASFDKPSLFVKSLNDLAAEVVKPAVEQALLRSNPISANL